MSGTFGGSNDENAFVSVGGKTVYAVVDATTGVTTYYERKGGNALQRAFTEDIKLGTIEPGGKFVPQKRTSTQPGFESVYSGDQAKEFLSNENQKELKSKAKETAQRGCEAASDGNTPEACATRTEQLLNNGEATTDPS